MTIPNVDKRVKQLSFTTDVLQNSIQSYQITLQFVALGILPKGAENLHTHKNLQVEVYKLLSFGNLKLPKSLKQPRGSSIGKQTN